MKRRDRENDYRRLQEELTAGRVRAVYIFYGDEDFFMEESAAVIRARIFPDGADKAVVNSIRAKEIPLAQVLDMAETVSLFGGARLVIVSDAPYFAKAEKDDDAFRRLLAISASDYVDACVIFYCTEFSLNLKISKELTATGVVFRFEDLKPLALESWLRQRLAAHGKTADGQALSLLIQRVGRDMRRLANEADKLAVYLGHRKELDETAVMEATARSLQGDIFALTDSVVSGRSARALVLLRDLLGAGEPPLRILAMLVRQFRMLGDCRELLQGGCAPDELAAHLGVPPFVANKLAVQARKTDDAALTRAVDLLLQADQDIKRGRVDQSLVMEALVVALGQKNCLTR